MKRRKIRILGINIFHGDAAAALLEDGNLVAAVEEERLNRIKHWAGFPSQSVKHVILSAGCDISEIDHVAISFCPYSRLARRLYYACKFYLLKGCWGGRADRIQKAIRVSELIRNSFNSKNTRPTFRIHFIEHHQTHIACAYWPSGLDEAAILSVDGMGDFVSTVFAHGVGRSWRRLYEVRFPHSLGYLYNAVTLFLGFPNYGDEYKVMGLASYGNPSYLKQFREIIIKAGPAYKLDLSYFTHSKTGIDIQIQNGIPVIKPFHSKKFESVFGPPRKQEEEINQRHQDIAASLQAVTEEVIISMLRNLQKLTKSKNLCLSGGVAMNSVANGKIREKTDFDKVFIPPAAADNGTSIGAAFYVWKKLGGHKNFKLDHAYWGTPVDIAQCMEACQKFGLKYLEFTDKEINCLIVETIIKGGVVGIFRGRMEFGARALGNRSLVADPRRGDIREIINSKIKFREKFRPFAPSVLEEYAHEFFENIEPSPFMEKVLRVRPEKRHLIPAVTHVDGTGRLHTVNRSVNEVYWELIELFRQRTNIPLILNTSFNENEPIVNTPEEALDCFLRTKIDAVVLGTLWVSR